MMCEKNDDEWMELLGNRIKISYSDMKDNLCRIEFETEEYKEVLQKLYLHMMNLSDEERIECLKRCYE